MTDSPSILFSLRALLPLVPRRERWRFSSLLALSLLMACSELALAGLVALFAAVFGSHDTVLNTRLFLWLRDFSHMDFSSDPRRLALMILCAILFSVIVKNVLNVVLQWHLTAFSESIGAAARVHIFRFYQRAPFLWIIHTGVADLNFGLNASTMLAITLATILQIFTSGLMLITLFVGLISALPFTSLIFLFVFGVIWTFVSRGIRKYLDRCSRTVYTVDYATNKILHLALHALMEMRLYCREKMLFSEYSAQLDKSVIAKMRRQAVGRLPVASLEILCFFALAAVMIFLVYGQNAGIARISGIMGFMAAAAWRGLPAGNRLVESFAFLRSLLPYLYKVVELMGLERSLNSKLLPVFETVPQILPSFKHRICLEDVSFRYPDAGMAALQDISINIKAGSVVGIIGFSGAGKSTLVNILTGLMPPDSGRVLIDDTPLNKDNTVSWLRRIGYVAQAPYILDASLAENVALSRWGEEIDRERVRTCCRMAAMEFLDELDKDIDTVLGDKGVRLSGGQAQRVAIARALYSDPDLIIFDEATSSLDMKNEKSIHETIFSLRGDVTMLVIAHRLHTLERCDELVWLEKGRIRRTGNVESILKEYNSVLRDTRGETETA
ncbi:MAG: ABC transporter ATP-binding protein/permease [Candidatus Accumulibacter sp.]|nr:ABC transporter ATP-binding protein/permease [Accumulibacter sp.]